MERSTSVEQEQSSITHMEPGMKTTPTMLRGLAQIVKWTSSEYKTGAITIMRPLTRQSIKEYVNEVKQSIIPPWQARELIISHDRTPDGAVYILGEETILALTKLEMMAYLQIDCKYDMPEPIFSKLYDKIRLMGPKDGIMVIACRNTYVTKELMKDGVRVNIADEETNWGIKLKEEYQKLCKDFAKSMKIKTLEIRDAIETDETASGSESEQSPGAGGQRDEKQEHREANEGRWYVVAVNYSIMVMVGRVKGAVMRIHQLGTAIARMMPELRRRWTTGWFEATIKTGFNISLFSLAYSTVQKMDARQIGSEIGKALKRGAGAHALIVGLSILTVLVLITIMCVRASKNKRLLPIRIEQWIKDLTENGN